MTNPSFHGPKAIRRANKAAVAAFFGVAITSVDGWIRRGCPFIRKGSLKSAWEFDLLAVAEWRFKGSAPDVQNDPDRMTPIDRKAWYDAELKRAAMIEKARGLIPAKELAQVVSISYSVIAESLRGLSDHLERRLSLPPEASAAVAADVDRSLEDLAERLGTLAPIPHP